VNRACGPHLYSISVILGTRPIPKAILMIPLLLWSQPIRKIERANLSCDDRLGYQRRPRLHQGPALGAEGATRQPLHVDGSRPYKPKKIHDGGDRAVQTQLATLYQVVVSFLHHNVLTRHHLADEGDFFNTKEHFELPPNRTSRRGLSTS
jgi:hypothetical protein